MNLRELLKRATGGEWILETVDTSIGTCHKIGPFPTQGVYDTTHACVYADGIRRHDYGHSKVGDELLANAALIVAAHNLLPELLTVVECAEKVDGELYVA